MSPVVIKKSTTAVRLPWSCRNLPAFPRPMSPLSIPRACYVGLDGQPEHSAGIFPVDKQVSALARMDCFLVSGVAHITKHLHLSTATRTVRMNRASSPSKLDIRVSE